MNSCELALSQREFRVLVTFEKLGGVLETILELFV